MKLLLIGLLVIFTIILILCHKPVVLEEQEVEVMASQPLDYPEFIEVGAYRAADEIFTANVTAYCHCQRCCGKPPTHRYYKVTASGKQVQEFHTVAMDKRFPFGTQVVFLNYEPFKDIVFVVEDRFGGGDHGNKLDVYFPSHAEALRFGRKKLEVAIYYAKK